MRITCTSCGHEVPPKEINIQTSLAKCPACGEVFKFGQDLGGESEQPVKLVMPKGYSVSHPLNDLLITHRWFTWKYIPMLLFCCIWDGFLITIYSSMLHNRNTPEFTLFIPLLHVAVGVFLTYYVIAGFLNSTELYVTDRLITVKHYPLPWPGNISIPVADIEQLFCEEVFNRNNINISFQYGFTYKVSVILHDGRRVPLVKELAQPNDARFLEQEVNARLGLQHRQVAGELRQI